MLRRNGRTAYHDSDLGKALVDRKADMVVESGLTLMPTPKLDVLGISKEQADRWSRSFMSRFELWAQSQKCMLEENQNFYQAQYMMSTSETRDGEYFIRLHYSDDPSLINPLQLQFIDPELIQGDAYTSTDGYQCPLDDGIERDANGREIAYHIERWSKAKKQFIKQRIPKYSKSGHLLMVHGYSVKYAGQYRGFSSQGQALQKLQKITTLDTATINKAINQAGLVLSVKPSKDAPAINPGMVPDSSRYRGSGVRPILDPGEAPTPTGLNDSFGYMEYPEATFSQPGSTMVFGMQAGEELVPFKDTSDHEQYAIFVEALVTYLAAGSGMSIEMLTMKFNQNYSASRATIELVYRNAKRERMNLETDSLNPIVEAFAAVEIARGNMRARGWLNPLMRAAWLHNRWIGAPRVNIDPAKEAKANKDNLEMGVTTISRIAREENGSDAFDNMRLLTEEYAELPVPSWSKSQMQTGDSGGQNNGGS